MCAILGAIAPRIAHMAAARTALVGCALLLAACAPAATSPAAPTTTATSAAPTVEERRLERPAPQEILLRSGFDDAAPALARALDGARSVDDADRTVADAGRALWRRAVDRVQGRGPQVGDLSRDDDRPLYWARLGLSATVRAWRPQGSAVDDGRRAQLLATLETTSRGQDTIAFPEQTPGVRRVLVTGFDPFTLDRDVRRSNPSGAVALALDGTTVPTAAGSARIEAATFPVRWTDFADGTVERVLAPQLPQVDLFTTISQGSPGEFDLERTNGAWRGGTADNENLTRPGTVPVADPSSQPQWTTTTLPSHELAARPTGRFPVVDHTEVTEVPADGGPPVTRPDGPTPGSTARAGGGGNYLSNEIAYRATLLRDRLGLTGRLPGGHLHTPVLDFAPTNADPATGTVTDQAFTQNRVDIVTQTRAVLVAAVDATRR